MWGRGFKLFSIYGFKIQADYSWLLIAVFLSASLAVGFFPTAYPGLSNSAYWLMGTAAMGGAFASIIAHELAHAAVARQYQMAISGITLFIFGGVANMDKEPPNARSEFFVAIAGPLASTAAAGFFYVATFSAASVQAPLPVLAVTHYLWFVNLLLAFFNLLPAFPLDGGRVLRAALWHFQGDLHQATLICSRIGSVFGLLLIAFGLLGVLAGSLIGGLWYVLIGAFLKNAASLSYKQLQLRRDLEGEPVSRFMKSDPISVQPDISVKELVQNYFYRYFYRTYPVVQGERLLGCISLDEVQGIPQNQWEKYKVGDLMVPASVLNTVSTGTDAVEALSKMNSSNRTLLLVAQSGKLAGIITLKDLLQFFSLKVELEESIPFEGRRAPL